MNDSDFKLVFDVTSNGTHSLWFPLPGLFFIILFLFFPQLNRSRPSFRVVGLAFAILWTIGASLSIFGQYWRDYSILKSGKASFVEGPVENFVPMPVTGHAMESFTVKGVPFSYSDYVITSGFNNTESHGGPIHEGLYVRVWYRGNDILKLEVKK